MQVSESNVIIWVPNNSRERDELVTGRNDSIPNPNNPVVILLSSIIQATNRQTSGESASLPQYLGCNTVFDMRLRVTFIRRKTVSLQSNITHRE